MKVPISWLKEFVEVSVEVEEYVRSMTMSGSKVECFGEAGEALAPVVAGRVDRMEVHPGKPHLFLAQTDIGERTIRIVTGDDRVREGTLVPVILEEEILQEDAVIQKHILREGFSKGRMCSIRELGLTTQDDPAASIDSIFLLPADTSPGADVKQLLGLDETVITFEITPNRPDCLSVVGLARESAATLGVPLMNRDPILREEGTIPVSNLSSVEVMDYDLCPRYGARVITDVRISHSPEWMRRRLRHAGVRPINNIVDITNYVMLETGQPMHAFDLDDLDERRIVVRKALEGEIIETLDEQIRPLDSSVLVIADGRKPVAVAGVIGGRNSEIGPESRSILLESANFNPVSVRLTAKKLGIRTESSARFEKGLDIHAVPMALDKACELVEMLGAGKIAPGRIDRCRSLPAPRTILLEPSRINALLGTDISTEKMADILERLGFGVDQNLMVSVPSFRRDVETMADLCEEVARFYGYNQIQPTLLSGKETTLGVKSKTQKIMDRIRDIMVCCNLHEICTYSFSSPRVFDQLNLPTDHPLRNALSLSNPLGEDYSIMRTTAIPEMLEVLSRNHSRKTGSCEMYEIAVAFRSTDAKILPEEKKILSIGMHPGDFFRVKGVVETLMGELGIEGIWKREQGHGMYHPGRCAGVYAKGRMLCILGQIHPAVAKAFDVTPDTCMAEIDLDWMIELSNSNKTYQSLPRFPSVNRDLAVIMDESINWGEVEAVIRRHGGNILENVHLFDVYRGEPIPEGKKSLAFSLIYRSHDRTLTDGEAGEATQRILGVLGEVFGGKLR